MRSFSVIGAEQRSVEWFAARLGRLTGSRADDMLATTQKGESAKRRDLRLQLVCERLTGASQEESFVNAAMQRGIDCEPLAFAAYEARTGEVVSRSGFLSHLEHMAGCSLDGHVEDFAGILECKCPKTATHLGYLRAGETAPAAYVGQITHNLWITGARWCDFVSFDDRLPEALSLVVVRVQRDERAIAAYEAKALAFLAEVDVEVEALRTLADLPAQLRKAVAQ